MDRIFADNNNLSCNHSEEHHGRENEVYLLLKILCSSKRELHSYKKKVIIEAKSESKLEWLNTEM